jgi:hypothetical protein
MHRKTVIVLDHSPQFAAKSFEVCESGKKCCKCVQKISVGSAKAGAGDAARSNVTKTLWTCMTEAVVEYYR